MPGRGQGRTRETDGGQESLQVGRNRFRLRVTGEGESGTQGGAPGDLYVVIHVPSTSSLSDKVATSTKQFRSRSRKRRWAPTLW